VVIDDVNIVLKQSNCNMSISKFQDIEIKTNNVLLTSNSSIICGSKLVCNLAALQTFAFERQKILINGRRKSFFSDLN